MCVFARGFALLMARLTTNFRDVPIHEGSPNQETAAVERKADARQSVDDRDDLGMRGVRYLIKAGVEPRKNHG